MRGNSRATPGAPSYSKWNPSGSCTLERMRARSSLIRAATSGSKRPMISAARCPAFRAPIAPTATVATGMPGGICTIERSEFEPRERRRGERHADHRQRGQRRQHAWEVRCRSSAGDEHPEPALGRGERVRAHDVTCSVRRHDPDLPADPVAVEHLAAGVHHRKIGLAPDHDPDAHRLAHDCTPAVTGRPMSVRCCMPSKCTRARLPYARARAAPTSAPSAVTQSTRPPAVRSVPSWSRVVPA